VGGSGGAGRHDGALVELGHAVDARSVEHTALQRGNTSTYAHRGCGQCTLGRPRRPAALVPRRVRPRGATRETEGKRQRAGRRRAVTTFGKSNTTDGKVTLRPWCWGRDETCPLSTKGGTRLVRLVRGRGGGEGHSETLVLTPMSPVGRSRSMASSSVAQPSASCAYWSLCFCAQRKLRLMNAPPEDPAREGVRGAAVDDGSATACH